MLMVFTEHLAHELVEGLHCRRLCRVSVELPLRWEKCSSGVSAEGVHIIVADEVREVIGILCFLEAPVGLGLAEHNACVLVMPEVGMYMVAEID